MIKAVSDGGLPKVSKVIFIIFFYLIWNLVGHAVDRQSTGGHGI
jgi:hypothetical protein